MRRYPAIYIRVMLFALFLLNAVMDWAPARWHAADAEDFALLKGTPVNCILVEREHWTPELVRAATEADIDTLGVVRPGMGVAAVNEAEAAGLTGVVLEGRFEAAERERLVEMAENAALATVPLLERTALAMNPDSPVYGTYQGVWPGIRVGEDGAAKAAPTGAPWIETNSGFLRFLQSRPGGPVWIGVDPPENEVVKLERYLQAVGDAAMVGARWIVSLDRDRMRRLLAREAAALEDWKRIMVEVAFWEEHRERTLYDPCGELALIQDVKSGGLLSNGIIDMLTARHTPLRTVPPAQLEGSALTGAGVALNIDPPALSEAQNELLRQFARSGGTTLTAPPGWDIHQEPGQMAVADKDVEILDEVWRGVNGAIGRRNLGVRLFNVAAARSELTAGPGGEPVVLSLVNFADYPVESITVRPKVKFEKAMLYRPGVEASQLEIFENGEIDIEEIESSAILVLTGASGPASAENDHH